MPIANAFVSGFDSGLREREDAQQSIIRAEEARSNKRSEVARLFNNFREMHPNASYAEYRSYIDQVTGGDTYLSGVLPTDNILRSMATESQRAQAQQQMTQRLQMMGQRATLQGQMDAAAQQYALQFGDDAKVAEALTTAFGPGAQQYIKEFFPNGFDPARQRATTAATTEYLPQITTILKQNPDADLSAMFPGVDPKLIEGVRKQAQTDLAQADTDRWNTNFAAQVTLMNADPQGYQPPPEADIGTGNLQRLIAMQKNLIAEQQLDTDKANQDRNNLQLETLRTSITSDPQITAIGPNFQALNQFVLRRAEQMGITLKADVAADMTNTILAEAEEGQTIKQRETFTHALDLLTRDPLSFELPPVSAVGQANFAILSNMHERLASKTALTEAQDSADTRAKFFDAIKTDPEFTDPNSGLLFNGKFDQLALADEIYQRATAAGVPVATSDVTAFIRDVMGDVKVASANTYETAAGAAKKLALETITTENTAAAKTMGDYYANDKVAEQYGDYAPSVGMVIGELGKTYNLADRDTAAAVQAAMTVENVRGAGVPPTNPAGIAAHIAQIAEANGAVTIDNAKKLVEATSMPDKQVNAQTYTSDLDTTWGAQVSGFETKVADTITQATEIAAGEGGLQEASKLIDAQIKAAHTQAETLIKIADNLPKIESQALVPGSGDLSAADALLTGYGQKYIEIITNLQQAKQRIEQQFVSQGVPAAPTGTPAPANFSTGPEVQIAPASPRSPIDEMPTFGQVKSLTEIKPQVGGPDGPNAHLFKLLESGQL